MIPNDNDHQENSASENDANDASTQSKSLVPQEPYHGDEFEEFIKGLSNAAIPFWKEIARATGVSRSTILRWSKHPRAIQAKKDGLNIAITGMAQAGFSNYQMYVKYLEMLGFVADINDLEDDHKEDDLVNSIKELAETMKLNASESIPTTEPPSSETPNQ